MNLFLRVPGEAHGDVASVHVCYNMEVEDAPFAAAEVNNHRNACTLLK